MENQYEYGALVLPSQKIGFSPTTECQLPEYGTNKFRRPFPVESLLEKNPNKYECIDFTVSQLYYRYVCGGGVAAATA